MYDTLGTVPKSNRKQPVERGKINTNNLQVYDLPLSWLGTGTSIKVAGLSKLHRLKPPLHGLKPHLMGSNLPSWAQTSPLNEIL